MFATLVRVGRSCISDRQRPNEKASVPEMREDPAYPPIGHYALISDCHAAALVSRSGSIDWCCIQRIDAGSCFGRLLDWEKGGFCSISPKEEGVKAASCEYVEETLVLKTVFRAAGGEANLYDCFAMPAGSDQRPYRELLRIVEGVRGHVELELKVSPRFDYGDIEPWVRQEGAKLYSAIGGNDGLLVSSDADIHLEGKHDLRATVDLHAGERVRLSMRSLSPPQLDLGALEGPGAEELDGRLEETIDRWSEWSSRNAFKGIAKPGVVRSALTVKGLMNDRTGAVVSTATTSLPENPGEDMNWDYRYSWVRESLFSVGALPMIGYEEEADLFRRFVQRSAAGGAENIQALYGVGGERRLTEQTLDYLEGYRGAKPVRIGNAASLQRQLDIYGDLLELAWVWYGRGHSPDNDYWRFLLQLVDAASKLWTEPDHGVWELRGETEHYVHSKVMCWAALDRGLKLTEAGMRKAPERRWKETRKEIREAVESKGYDEERGVFVRAFGSRELDATLLLLPRIGFVDYKDERMIRTTEAVREDLDDHGLLKRFRGDAHVGAVVVASFWLAEVLAHQGRTEQAQETFDRALAASSGLGLFSEAYDTDSEEPRGNYPHCLTHLSHISAALALAEH